MKVVSLVGSKFPTVTPGSHREAVQQLAVLLCPCELGLFNEALEQVMVSRDIQGKSSVYLKYLTGGLPKRNGSVRAPTVQVIVS